MGADAPSLAASDPKDTMAATLFTTEPLQTYECVGGERQTPKATGDANQEKHTKGHRGKTSSQGKTKQTDECDKQRMKVPVLGEPLFTTSIPSVRAQRKSVQQTTNDSAARVHARPKPRPLRTQTNHHCVVERLPPTVRLKVHNKQQRQSCKNEHINTWEGQALVGRPRM